MSAILSLSKANDEMCTLGHFYASGKPINFVCYIFNDTGTQKLEIIELYYCESWKFSLRIHCKGSWGSTKKLASQVSDFSWRKLEM